MVGRAPLPMRHSPTAPAPSSGRLRDLRHISSQQTPDFRLAGARRKAKPRPGGSRFGLPEFLYLSGTAQIDVCAQKTPERAGGFRDSRGVTTWGLPHYLRAVVGASWRG